MTGNLGPTRNVDSHFQEHSNTAVLKRFEENDLYFCILCCNDKADLAPSELTVC